MAKKAIQIVLFKIVYKKFVIRSWPYVYKYNFDSFYNTLKFRDDVYFGLCYKAQ